VLLSSSVGILAEVNAAGSGPTKVLDLVRESPKDACGCGGGRRSDQIRGPHRTKVVVYPLTDTAV
jgi:hypothetical protein